MDILRQSDRLYLLKCSNGFIRIGCNEYAPARISEPDTNTVSKPSAVT